MTDPSTARHPVSQINVRLLVGASLLSASDDPLYLGLRGPGGREFRRSWAMPCSIATGFQSRRW